MVDGEKYDVRLKRWNGDICEQRIEQLANCGKCSSALGTEMITKNLIDCCSVMRGWMISLLFVETVC